MMKPTTGAQKRTQKILLDVADLDERPTSCQGTSLEGVEVVRRPLSIPLDEIEEDSQQPRTEFSEASLAELAESIRQHGVKSTISVRPHPTGAKT